MTRRKTEPLADVQGAVAMAARKGDKTLAELAQQFDVHPNQIADWKTQLMERSAQVLGDSPSRVRIVVASIKSQLWAATKAKVLGEKKFQRA